MNLPRVAIISGFKESGKTRVVEESVEELKERDYRVGTIKHIPMEDFTLDQPETDTWRHAQAGAEMIISISPGEVVTLEKRGADLEEVLLRLVSKDLDFVLIEGFREAENVPKLMVARDEEEASELEDDFTVGFVGKGVGEKPVMEKEDITSIADLIEERAIPPVGGLDCGECGYSSCREFALAAIDRDTPKNGCVPLGGPVTLKVDGKNVPLKPFVKDLIANTVSGMVSSLRKTEGDRIEIVVERNEG